LNACTRNGGDGKDPGLVHKLDRVFDKAHAHQIWLGAIDPLRAAPGNAYLHVSRQKGHYPMDKPVQRLAVHVP
jgi:hypothetical protein